MPGFGFLGLGVLRRPVTIALCGVAFWAGTEVQATLLGARCETAGGTVDARGVCRGLR